MDTKKVQALLRELRRKRKEQHCEQQRRRWNPELIKIAELHDILDFVENKLAEMISSEAASHARRARMAAPKGRTDRTDTTRFC